MKKLPSFPLKMIENFGLNHSEYTSYASAEFNKTWSIKVTFALFITILVIGIKLVFQEQLGLTTPTLFAIFSVVASALYGGFHAGFISLLLNAILINYFFLPPYKSFLLDPHSMLILLIFILEGYFIVWIIERQRKAAWEITLANKSLEKRVEERTIQLSKLNTELQRSNSELESFASVASHDLQEPLRKIQAFGDRLESVTKDTLSSEAKDYLARMQSAASRMRVLIEDLLAFSRVTTKAQPYTKVDLDLVLKEVLSDLEVRITEKKGKIVSKTLPVIEADPIQMRQLFQNLISNGLKFQKAEETPVITISTKDMYAKDPLSLKERAHIQISIKDNGIGFEEKYLDRIFQVFQRLHGRNEYEGTGIGLAVCRKIAERHNGSITAKSRPGKGATFIVTLPITQADK